VEDWAPETKSSENIRRFIESSRASEHDVEGNGLIVDGAIVGSAGMSVDPRHEVGDIGYWIDERFEGRGLITGAARLFLDHGFRRLDLHRISIHAAVENRRSRAVPERLGFTMECVLREAGRPSPATSIWSCTRCWPRNGATARGDAPARPNGGRRGWRATPSSDRMPARAQPPGCSTPFTLNVYGAYCPIDSVESW
jgi:RimJ/RimL family protein N-acetyltransferase